LSGKPHFLYFTIVFDIFPRCAGKNVARVPPPLCPLPRPPWPKGVGRGRGRGEGQGKEGGGRGFDLLPLPLLLFFPPFSLLLPPPLFPPFLSHFSLPFPYFSSLYLFAPLFVKVLCT